MFESREIDRDHFGSSEPTIQISHLKKYFQGCAACIYVTPTEKVNLEYQLWSDVAFLCKAMYTMFKTYM